MWTRQSLQTPDRAPSAILQAAATALEFSHRTNGTYAGATPEAVTVVQADQFRFGIGQQVLMPLARDLEKDVGMREHRADRARARRASHRGRPRVRRLTFREPTPRQPA